jgi:exosortase/archaeosortase family protein
MKKNVSYILDIVIRYSILLVTGIFSSIIFYSIFYLLTIYPLYFIFKIFFDVSIFSNTIFVRNFPVEIIEACVASSAYYLLFILNLSIPNIKISKRIKMLAFSFGLFLIINLLRIFLLSLLLISGNSLFDLTHKLFWYAGSTIFLVGIWFLSVKLFKIREIPFYSDMKYLFKLSKKTKNPKRSKKH